MDVAEMTSPQDSRLERLAFSSKDEDFRAFSEQFEATMDVLKRGTARKAS